MESCFVAIQRGDGGAELAGPDRRFKDFVCCSQFRRRRRPTASRDVARTSPLTHTHTYAHTSGAPSLYVRCVPSARHVDIESETPQVQPSSRCTWALASCGRLGAVLASVHRPPLARSLRGASRRERLAACSLIHWSSSVYISKTEGYVANANCNSVNAYLIGCICCHDRPSVLINFLSWPTRDN